MLLRPPTDEQLRQTFTGILTAMSKGELNFCPTGTGLDEQTVSALNRYAISDKLPTDEVAARTEFARMLDGTHLAEYHEEESAAWAKLLGG